MRRPPRGAALEHGVEDYQQFAHAGHQRNLSRLASGQQTSPAPRTRRTRPTCSSAFVLARGQEDAGLREAGLAGARSYVMTSSGCGSYMKRPRVSGSNTRPSSPRPIREEMTATASPRFPPNHKTAILPATNGPMAVSTRPVLLVSAIALARTAGGKNSGK